MLDQLEAAIGPLLPGLVVAAIFMLLLVALRVKFRGTNLARAIKRPIGFFYFYIFLFVLTVATQLYWPGFFRITYLIALLVLSLAVILALSMAVFDLFLGRVRQVQVPAILRDLVVLVVYIIVMLVVMSQTGVNVTSIITTSAVLTAVIGFALQDLLSNIISGLAIQMERPFGVGDWVKFKEQEGKVLEINWRSTKMETLHRDIVIIPNNMATSSAIINFSKPTDVHRRKVTIGLRYEAAPNRVQDSLLKAVRGVDGVLEDPEPFVGLREFSDHAITYRLFFFIDDFSRRDRIEQAVNLRLWYQLRRDGLSVPFPIRDVNVRTISREDEERERERKTAAITDLLGRIHFMEPLSAEEHATLAGRLRSEFYAAGEAVIRQGDAGSSFYIIADGEVEVRVSKSGRGTGRVVTTLGSHDFFGEMSLMTGEDRSATVLATRDSEFYVIDKAAFAGIIKANDALVTKISEHLAARVAVLKKATQDKDGGGAAAKAEGTGSIVNRIRRFFQLG